MDKTISQIKGWVSALLGLLTGLWGWLGWLVVGWIGCMALDYLTGSLAAGTDLLIEIVLVNLPVLALPIQYPGLVCPVVLVWYIVTELGSMAENAAIMGAPVPKWLVKLLALSKQAVDSAGDKLDGDEDG